MWAVFQLALAAFVALSLSLLPEVMPYPEATTESCLDFCREVSLKVNVSLSIRISCGEGSERNKCGTLCKGHCEEHECEEYITRKGTFYQVRCPEESNAWWQAKKKEEEAQKKAEEERKEKERKEEEERKRKEKSEKGLGADIIFAIVFFPVLLVVAAIAIIVYYCKVWRMINADRRGGPRLLGQTVAVAPGQLPLNGPSPEGTTTTSGTTPSPNPGYPTQQV